MKKLIFTLLFAAAGLSAWADEPTDYLAIVGGATKAGWPGSPNADNRSVGQMVKTGDHTWVWVGKLTTGSDNAGNFKFSWTTNDWNGYWANSDDLSVGDIDTKTYTLSTNGSGDVKYHVNSTGIYRITIYDTNSTPKMKVEKLAQPPMDNNYYQIETVDQFMWFVGNATSDGATAKAKLTADIDFTGKDYFPIGCETYKFQGEIDGGGHCITLAINSKSNYQGLVGHATGGVTIKNLILKGSVTSTGSKTAGFIAEANGEGTIAITNCGNEATISGGAGETAAIIANNYGSSCKLSMNNVYNIGNVSGSGDVSTICAYQGNYDTQFTNVYNSGIPTDNDGTLESHFVRGAINQNAGNPTSIGTYTRCYSTTLNQNTQHDNSNVTNIQKIDNTDVTSGKLCFLLNGETSGGTNWYQTLAGTDNQPYPFDTHKQVYQVSETSYTNIPVSDGKVQISNANDLVTFSAEVNAGNTALNAVLTEDIDMTGVTSWIPIGKFEKTSDGDKDDKNDGSKAYNGTFDGKGHTIDNLVQDVTTYNNQGLFGVVNGGCNIKNLILGSGCKFYGGKYVGAFVGSSRGSGWVTIENCGNEANVGSDNNKPTKHAAAFIGVVVNNGPKTKILNCYNTGVIKGENGSESAILTGWFGGHSDVEVKNFYNIGSVENPESGKPLYRNGNTGITFTNNYSTTPDQDATQIGNNWTTSGELCYKLNGDQDIIIWHQTLAGIDSHPYPFNTHKQVYQVSETSYTNIPVSGGKVQISNAEDLMTFSAEVNAGNTALNAVLTNDIDMSGVNDYTPIGTADNLYSGTFDGDTHRIKNLVINNDIKEQGLFSVCTGATIKNLILDSSCSIKSTKSAWANAAFVAVCNGSGTLTFENCGNEASVEGTSGNNAAFLGKNWSSTGLKIVLKNCYNTGAIKGGSYNAAFVGESDEKEVTTTNCYNKGNVERNDGGNATWINGKGTKNITNCYTTLSSGELSGLTTSYSEDKITSGELCYKLGPAFTQDLSQDGHPTFGSKTVTAGKWFNDTDNDVYYNEESGNITVYKIDINENQTAYNVPANVKATHFSFTRNYIANQWVGICTPISFLCPSDWEARELTDVTGNGENASMKFSEVTAIYAGKPYIVKPSRTEETIFSGGNTSIISADKYETNKTKSINGINMIGNLCQTDLTTGDFYINTSSQLKKLTAASATLKGFRAYFTVDGGSGVKALSFDFDDDATGISLMEDGRSKMEDGAIYNLAGQRIQKMQKGINIVNGKKILK